MPLKLPLNNSTTIEIPLKWKGSSSRGRTLLPLKYQYNRKGGAPEDGLWSTRGRLRFVVPRSAEECDEESGVGPSSAGKGWGRHWGAFKLLYNHCNTTKIDRVEQPGRLVVPKSAAWDRVVPGEGGADIGVPLNYSTTIEIPLK